MINSAIAFLLIAFVSFNVDARTAVDVNDVSYLWAPPTRASEAAKLVLLSDVIPKAVFEEIILFSEGASLQGQKLPTAVNMPREARKIENWRVIAMRIDPCAPSVVASGPNLSKCRQEVRLVAQPFFFDGLVWDYYDFAFHIIYEISTGAPRSSVSFKKFWDQLLLLKEQNQKAGIETVGVPLGVHPGFKNENFRTQFQTLLGESLAKFRLKKITFTGAENVDGPWVFFQGLVVNQRYQLEPDPTMRHSPFGEISPGLPGFGGTLSPLPYNSNWSFSKDFGMGPSIADLFYTGTLDLDQPARLPDSSESQVFKLRDLARVFENPTITDPSNTDCFSCHTAMSRGLLMNLNAKQNPFQYVAPNGHVTMDAVFSSSSPTNFRIFGWFGSRPVVADRVINESASVADMLEKLFLETDP